MVPLLTGAIQVSFGGVFYRCGKIAVLIARRKGCKCQWRRAGSKIGPKKIPCQDGKGECECRAAFRECDPEVCGRCHARYATSFLVSQGTLTRRDFQRNHSRYWLRTRACPNRSRKLRTGIKGYACANVSLQKGHIKVGSRCTALALADL